MRLGESANASESQGLPDQDVLQGSKHDRSRFRCPEKLRILIELANLVLPDQPELPDLGWTPGTFSFTDSGEWLVPLRNGTVLPYEQWGQLLGTLLAPYSEIIAKAKSILPPGRLNLILIAPSKTHFENFVSYHYYRLIRNSGKLLRTIVERIRQTGGEPGTLMSRSVYLVTDKHGTIRIEKDFFEEAVTDVESAAFRIRECAHCRAIFWAARHDAKCCSTKHAQLVRSKRHYKERVSEENRRLYNQARKRRRFKKGE